MKAEEGSRDLGPGAPGPGREIEITRGLRLGADERQLIEMHSVHNVLNLAVFQIDAVGALVGTTVEADQMTDQLLEWHAELKDLETVLAHLRRAPEFRRRLVAWMEEQRSRVPADRLPELERHIDNLRSIFATLEARVEELIERHGNPGGWAAFTLAQLRTGLEEAFRAIEKNSLGRWRIAFSAAERPPGAYLMEIDLTSRDGASIRIPTALGDVMRDLALNARKFTDPGGRIGVTLAEKEDGILLRVTDTGRGIPEGEIEDVVSFGYRGSNNRKSVQFGGGFGLTKAYFVTKAFGGRMWIRSAPSAGTTVTIKVPKAESS